MVMWQTMRSPTAVYTLNARAALWRTSSRILDALACFIVDHIKLDISWLWFKRLVSHYATAEVVKLFELMSLVSGKRPTLYARPPADRS